jgi:hypothetical protein
MTEMIERVAEALRGEFEPYRVFDEGEAERLARAAIEAMREPTAAMWSAEQPLWALGRPMWDWWRDMIDAVLGVTRCGGERGDDET